MLVATAWIQTGRAMHGFVCRRRLHKTWKISEPTAKKATMNTLIGRLKMMQHTQDERPEKSDDHELLDISETLKSRPVGFDFLIRTGGAMRGNCILRVARHLL